MSGAASFGAGYAPGSGRTFSTRWPAVLGPITAADVGVGPTNIGRQAGQAPAVNNNSSRTVFGAGSGANWFTNYKGRGGGLQFFAGPAIAGNGARYQLITHTIWPVIGNAAVDEGSPADAWLCWRSYGVFAMTNGTIANDQGLQWCTDPAARGTMIADGNIGVAFQQTAADEISFIRRPAIAGPITSSVVRKTSAADVQKWHSYEIRVLGATARSRARLIALIDSIPVFNALWITDPSLPNPPVHTGVFGLTPVVVSRSGTGMFCHYVETMAGPNQASLL